MTSRNLMIGILALSCALLLLGPVFAAKPWCGDGKCNGGENADSCPSDCGGGGGGTDPVAVCVQFRDATDDLVAGDAPVEYCDGQDGVSATIGANAGVFKLDTTGKSSNREVVVNFPGCDSFPGVDSSSGDCLTPALLVTRNGYTSAGDPTGEKVNLLLMDVGPTSELVDFQINFPSTLSKSTPNVVVFGGQSADPCGLPLLVSHPDADTWTVTTPGASDEACLWEVTGKNGKRRYLIDPFALPFEITITRAP